MLLLFFFHNRTFSKRKYVVSTIDNKRYLVQKKTKAQETKSANMIAELVKRKNILCNYLESNSKYQNKYEVKRLLNNQYVEIEEKSFKYKDQVAYSINKGEKIGICLRNKQGKYEDMNTGFFVLMHELAHVMSKDYGHHEKFWNNFSLLIKAAIECKVYTYQSFDNYTNFCGLEITYTPYKK